MKWEVTERKPDGTPPMLSIVHCPKGSDLSDPTLRVRILGKIVFEGHSWHGITLDVLNERLR